MTPAPAILALLIALLFGWLLPVAVMRMLDPTLERGGPPRTNFRGRSVRPSLGLVWVVWILGLAALQATLDLLLRVGGSGSARAVLERLWTTPLALPFFVIPFMLVTGSAALGLADDVFGGEGPKGFRGHLGALKQGRLTTGMLKMGGIGALALFYGVSAADGILERSAVAAGWSTGPGAFVVACALATIVIALSANLLNLLDLRPGRALKAYVVLVPVPAVALALSATAAYNSQASAIGAGLSRSPLQAWEGAAAAAAFVIAVIGPALAVWSRDLHERAMLGDAGSNAMGAIVGYLLTATLPLSGLAAAAVALLVLNLLSERVSFSAVIDRSPPLRWLDGLGRKPLGTTSSSDATDSAPPVAAVRYHSDEGANERED